MIALISVAQVSIVSTDAGTKYKGQGGHFLLMRKAEEGDNAMQCQEAWCFHDMYLFMEESVASSQSRQSCNASQATV